VSPEIFIGYKDVAEIFEQYELFNNQQSMGYQIYYDIREVFINSCFFAKEEKENNRFAHYFGNHYKMEIILTVESKFQ
jgi:hypothetical protein